MSGPTMQSPQLNGDWSWQETLGYLIVLVTTTVLQIVAGAVTDAGMKQALIVASSSIAVVLTGLHLFLDKLASDRYHSVRPSLVELTDKDPPPLTEQQAGAVLRFLPTKGDRTITLPSAPSNLTAFVIENLAAAYTLRVVPAPAGAAAEAAMPPGQAALEIIRGGDTVMFVFSGTAYVRH